MIAILIKTEIMCPCTYVCILRHIYNAEQLEKKSESDTMYHRDSSSNGYSVASYLYATFQLCLIYFIPYYVCVLHSLLLLILHFPLLSST